ncbi:MAG: EF-P lysine aminoacylase EpmA [Gammaproteobacteria bacterium]|nr:EF-P lysine aminoacylase EpmA [Gammaproteobacteria bacterium]
MMTTWQPTASLEMLQTRARLLSKLRAFFADKDIYEVQTPVLSHAGNTEPSIETFVTQQSEHLKYPLQPSFLNTSPEFAMKRLLAAGSGSIYQITPVFRQGEQSKKHNPEFTLLEWYRLNFDHHALMGEVNLLIRFIAKDFLAMGRSHFYSYQDAMIKFADVDPFTASIEELKAATVKAGIDVVGMEENTSETFSLETSHQESCRNGWLDLLMCQVVEKNLPLNCPVFIYDYPASQAALAKIRKGSPDVAERFELYINGVELANGFHELSDAAEQAERFKKEQQIRKERGLPGIPADTHLIAALKHGLPDCAGVAIGFDRLLMVLTGAQHINDVLTFPFDRA